MSYSNMKNPPWIEVLQKYNDILYFMDHVLSKYDLTGNVLEIGCGRRAWVSLIIKSYFDSIVITTDIIHEKVRSAKLIGRRLGVESDEYVVADASHLPFKDGIFDKVVGNAILHHVLKKLDTVAEEIFRVTRSGGPNVFAGEIVASRPIGWLWKRTVLRKNPSEGLATKEHWTRAFERAGFTDVEVSMEDRYGYAKVLGRNVYYGLVRHFPKEFVTGWLITSATIAFQKASEN